MKKTRYWKAGLCFRPNHIGNESGIQVSDCQTQSRYIASAIQLTKLIMSLDDPENLNRELLEEFESTGLIVDDISQNSVFSEGLAEWQKNGWGLSANYYQWSKRYLFLDEGENYDVLRCKALERMLENSPIPLPKEIAEENKINLPEPRQIPLALTLGEVLKKRRTHQTLPNKIMPQDLLSSLLRYGFQETRKQYIPNSKSDIRELLQGCGVSFDVYISMFNVENMEKGVYYYDINSESLELTKAGNFRQEVYECLVGHKQALDAACTIFLVADFARFQWRYRHERALRNLYIDAGRLAQYLILVATSLSIKNHLTPAVKDLDVCNFLQINPEEKQVFYSLTFG